MKIAIAKLIIGAVIAFIVFASVPWYAVMDFAGLLQDIGQHQMSGETTAPSSNGTYNRQRANTSDGGGYQRPGSGCKNGKQQRPDGYCPPLQGPEHGRIERDLPGFRGSWPEKYIPNGSIIPVDRNGNIRQLRCGEEGAFPCGFKDDGRNLQ